MTPAAMTQPTAYVPAHSFVADGAVIPEFPGAAIDVELNALETFTQQVRTNLALLQRDDGALANGIVTAESLDTVLAAGLGDLSSLATVTALVATANADVVLTHADVVLTHADVVLTHADVVLTHADVITAAASAAAAAASAATTGISGLTNHGVPIANTATSLNTSIALTDGQLLVGQTGANPLAKTITGDVTIDAAGATAIKTSVSLTTPTLGVAAATSINKVAITAPASSATLTIANGKTLTANATLTLTGTDGTTFTFPVVSSTVLTLASGGALTAGFTSASVSAGTKTTGTYTFDPTAGAVQNVINGGAHTFAPPATHGSWMIDYVNNASAGALTTSGWTKVDGDALTTTNTHAFRGHMSVGNSGSLLTWKKMV